MASTRSRITVALLTVVCAFTVAPPAQATPEPKAPPQFVALHDLAPTVLREIRYDTPHDFMGVPVDGYRKPMCLLTRDAALGRGGRNGRSWPGATR